MSTAPSARIESKRKMLMTANFKQCILRAGLLQVTRFSPDVVAGMEDTLQLN
jgi:hypothetical protein